MPRPFADVQRVLLDRARARRNPFSATDPQEAVRIVAGLRSTAHDEWVAAFTAAARGHEARALEAAVARDDAAERAGTALAYGYHRVARYPAPTSDAKRAAYRRSQQWYARLARWSDPPLERVRIPFPGRPGEGDAVSADLRVPRGAGRPPVVALWGGIDSFKEERRPEPFLARGLATLAMDMPGTGDAPIVGSADADRLWDPVLDWLAARADVNGTAVALVGSSTGGYWAAKLAYTRRERIIAAVDHGGPVHFAFEREWIERSAGGEYPFELAESLAAAFGWTTEADWIAGAPALSLLRLGVLGRPCAPLLVAHGVDDTVFPVADQQLLLAHGTPIEGRSFPGGHMGVGPELTSAIAEWVAARLAR